MRKSRKQSSTDIYHVMIQGVNKHLLFEDNEDFDYFIKVLNIVKKKYMFELFSYCLMDNHVHFLIKATKKDLADIMKNIQLRYYHWFHRKYDYEGHLFNGRYKSKEVETQSYFQNLINYIHNNPVKAGLCCTPSEYKYSSIEYYNNNIDGLVDTQKSISYFGTTDITKVLNYINQNNSFVCIDIKERTFTDQEAIKVINNILSHLKIPYSSFIKGNFSNNLIKQIKKTGVTVAQLRRYTGLPFNILKVQWNSA